MKIHSPLQTCQQVSVALLLALVPVKALHAAGFNAPGAGSLLQQMQPAAPALPFAEARVSIDREGHDPLPSSAPFLVKTIRISGNTVFATATLQALVAEAEGKNLTLSELGERVERITAYYQDHGYPLAQAVILAQVIEDGVLVIDVIEARFGEITLNNLSRVNGRLLQSTLSSLESGQPIGETELNHALLLLSDLPGIAVNATLQPGDAVGTSDLLVNTISGAGYSGSMLLDSYGSRSTGKVRLSATVNFINPLHHGDVLTVSGLSSGRGTNHGRLAYESLLSGQGTRLGVSYSTLHYILGEPFTALNAHGTAQLKTIWVKTPLKRSRKFNLSGHLQYDALQLRDRIDVGAVQTDRHLGNAAVSFTGDARDSFLSSGITMWSVGWKTGRLTFDDAAAQSTDAATAGTEGEFSRWNVNVSRLQRLTPRNSLYLAFAGQWANANLDSSEKMTAGGPYSVRAYDVGALSGDSGFFGTAELRRDLGVVLNTRWEAVAFIERAQLVVNRAQWVSGTNRVALTGTGVGLNIAAPKQWTAKISLAARIGSAPALVTHAASGRLWLELSRGF